MKLIDILDKKVIWFKDTDCGYYWDFKYIVELDEEHYALINHSGSMSGWNPLFFESVDKEFVSAFLNGYDYDDRKFEKVDNKILVDFTGNNEYSFKDDGEDFSLIDIITIEKETVDRIIKELTDTE